MWWEVPSLPLYKYHYGAFPPLLSAVCFLWQWGSQQRLSPATFVLKLLWPRGFLLLAAYHAELPGCMITTGFIWLTGCTTFTGSSAKLLLLQNHGAQWGHTVWLPGFITAGIMLPGAPWLHHPCQTQQGSQDVLPLLDSALLSASSNCQR